MTGLRIGIQPDYYGPEDASSPIWASVIKQAGHEVQEVNVYRADILDQLRGCHGFMWRYPHFPSRRQVARRLLAVIEQQLGLVVYPDQNTCWHYDDKIAQAYLFSALKIPAPRTWVWFDRDLALDFAASAPYPLVMKLCSGAGSRNVMLLKSSKDARVWIRRIFGRGVTSLAGPRNGHFKRWMKAAKSLIVGAGIDAPWEVHKDYALLQEFLAGNRYDTRVTVIGDRAFAFRRFNRSGDFRASGSGLIDHDPYGIDAKFVQLAFDTAKKLKAQSCAIDGMWRGDEAVVGEVSYTYASWAVHKCPGHWDSSLKWHEGSMRPEEAQVRDYIARLERACTS